MKGCAIFVVLCFVGVYSHVTNDFLSKIEPFKAECISESNADPNLVKKLLEEDDYVDDKNLKCFTKCIFVKLDVMNADGEVQEDHIRDSLSHFDDKSKIDIVMQKCADLNGDDPCETAYNIAKCTHDVLRD